MSYVVGIESNDDGEVSFIVGPWEGDSAYVDADAWMEQFLADHPSFDRDFIWVGQVIDPESADIAEFFEAYTDA